MTPLLYQLSYFAVASVQVPRARLTGVADRLYPFLGPLGGNGPCALACAFNLELWKGVKDLNLGVSGSKPGALNQTWRTP